MSREDRIATQLAQARSIYIYTCNSKHCSNVQQHVSIESPTVTIFTVQPSPQTRNETERTQREKRRREKIMCVLQVGMYGCAQYEIRIWIQ